MPLETVLGLEVHVQLNTRSKLFSESPTAFGALANRQTSFIDAGFPGVLPVLNQEAVTKAIFFGLAIGATIHRHSYFERKNYFYPDLPKGYQISQYQEPIVQNGSLWITTASYSKKVHIERAHLEEDAGKSLHDVIPDNTTIDLNRAGIPLLEIVTTPCLSSAEEALAYLKSLQELVRFLQICDGNMQEGSFRCDVNISRRPQGSTTLGVRTELKNLNSFKFIEKAIHYEEWRQQEAIENGLSLQQETRLFCPHTQKTKPLRSKENAQDYRYFPDPDLLPIVISEEEIRLYQKMLPPLPSAIRAKLAAEEMGEEDLHFLLSHPSIYQYFTAVQSQTDANSKIIINWLRGPLQTLLQQEQYSFENIPIAASELALLLDALWQKTLSYHDAKELLTTHWQKKQSIQALLQTLPRKETEVVSKVIQAVLEEYPAQQQQYKEGKEKLLAFFVGQVLKRLPTKVDPTFIQQALKEKLA